MTNLCTTIDLEAPLLSAGECYDHQTQQQQHSEEENDTRRASRTRVAYSARHAAPSSPLVLRWLVCWNDHYPIPELTIFFMGLLLGIGIQFGSHYGLLRLCASVLSSGWTIQATTRTVHAIIVLKFVVESIGLIALLSWVDNWTDQDEAEGNDENEGEEENRQATTDEDPEIKSIILTNQQQQQQEQRQDQENHQGQQQIQNNDGRKNHLGCCGREHQKCNSSKLAVQQLEEEEEEVASTTINSNCPQIGMGFATGIVSGMIGMGMVVLLRHGK